VKDIFINQEESGQPQNHRRIQKLELFPLLGHLESEVQDPFHQTEEDMLNLKNPLQFEVHINAMEKQSTKKKEKRNQ
jgi:hypothetical protein